jgi:methionyl-tRNA formyltransferase
MRCKSDTSRARILLIGHGASAQSALEALVERFNVIGIVRATHPDEATPDSVVMRAKALGVPVFGNLAVKAVEGVVTELRPECVVVSSYAYLLPPALLEKSRFINVHYSPLPRCRGMNAVNWALINGDAHAGLTIHTVVPGMDEGRILFQRLLPIRRHETIVTLVERLNAVQREALGDTVQRHLEGYAGESQHQDQATYTCARIPADGEIDWSRSAQSLGRLVRALVEPFPGAFTYYEGRRLVVWRAEAMRRPPRFEGRIPGRVVGVARDEGTIDVLAGRGIVRVREVQLDGEVRMPAAAVVNSIRATLGLRIGDVLRRVEALENLLRTRS